MRTFVARSIVDCTTKQVCSYNALEFLSNDFVKARPAPDYLENLKMY